MRSFLVRCRERLRPEDVGRTRPKDAGGRGLRPQDLAELLGVSPLLYQLFETGAYARAFSFDFVRRVADALRLDSRDRDTLHRLALPGTAEATDQLERSLSDGAARCLRQIRQFTKRADAASSFAEVALLAVRTAQRVLAPDSLTAYSNPALAGEPAEYATGPRARYWGRLGQQFAFRTLAGPHGESVAVSQRMLLPEDALGATTRIVFENVGGEGRTPAELEYATEQWHEINRVRVQSGILVALHEGGAYSGTLGVAFTEPFKILPIDIEFLMTLGAIVDLTAAAGKKPL